jgi:hypothetical protein
MKTNSNETLRERLTYIVTRGGMSARIPEMLELELNDLESLVASQRKEAIRETVDELDILAVTTDNYEDYLRAVADFIEKKRKDLDHETN